MGAIGFNCVDILDDLFHGTEITHMYLCRNSSGFGNDRCSFYR